MILDGKTLTPTELILLHIQLETEDVRDDDTLRLVSMVATAAVQAPRAAAAQQAPAMDALKAAAQVNGLHRSGEAALQELHGFAGGEASMGALLARVMWDGRMVEV